MFFLAEVADDAALVWNGVQRLEHVFIALDRGADAQQVFESLNSTGEPLENHELVHNFILMGLTHQEQTHIEQTYWIPVEKNTGSSIDDFWRDDLIQRTGRDNTFTGRHGIFTVFKEEFARLDSTALDERATEWLQFSDVYRTMSHPEGLDDEDLEQQLVYSKLLGSAHTPITMRLLWDYRNGVIDRD